MVRGLVLTVLSGLVSLTCWANGHQLQLSVGPFWLNTSDFALGNEVVGFGAQLDKGAYAKLSGTGYSIDAAYVIPAQLGAHNGIRLAYEYWNIDETTESYYRNPTVAGTFLGILPIDPSSARPISYFNSISDGEFSHDTDSHTLSLYLMGSSENCLFEQLTWGYGLVAGYYRSNMDFYLQGIDIATPVMEDDDFEVETTKVGLGIMVTATKQLPKEFALTLGAEARLCLGWQKLDGTQRQTGGSFGDAVNTAEDDRDAIIMPEVILSTGLERPVGNGFILFVQADARYMGNMPELQMPYGDYSEVSDFGLGSSAFYGFRVMAGVRKDF